MRRFVSLLLLCSIAACGGGGGGSAGMPETAVGGGTSALPSLATVTFTLAVPASDVAADARRAQYISQSMQSLVVTLISQNGVQVGTPQPYAASITYSACSGAAVVSTARTTLVAAHTCTLPVPAPAGSDTFVVSTYDAAQSSATPTTPTGNVLSTAQVTTTVVSGAANNVPLTLNGVVAVIALSIGNPMPFYGSGPVTTGLLVTGKDADGNIIVGPGNFTQTVTLHDSDTTGATTLSTTTVTAPQTGVTITYNGVGALTAVFTGTAPGAVSGSATLTSQVP